MSVRIDFIRLVLLKKSSKVGPSVEIFINFKIN